jgi:hypothetical protein
MKGTVEALLAASLIASGSASAQGIYSNGIRSGYRSPVDSSPSTTTPAASSSTPSSSTRNLGTGTGRGRTEGAMGLTRRLQRELGIGRQQ